MGLLFGGFDADIVNCGSGTSLDNLDPRTWALWIYPTAVGNQRVAGKGSGSPTTNMAILSPGMLTGFANSDTGDSFDHEFRSQTNFITVDTWQFVAWTLDQGASPTGHLYRGTLSSVVIETPSYSKAQNGDTNLTNESSYDLGIGNVPGLSQSFYGTIGWMGVWNIVLSASQLDMQRRLRHIPVEKDNNVLFMHIGLHGSGGIGTQPDWSGYGNNGTVSGATKSFHMPLTLFPFKIWQPYAVTVFPFSDDFTGTNYDPWNTAKWTTSVNP